MNSQRWMGCLVLLMLTAVPARADDSPQWRGPLRNGISKEKGLLGTWPEGGPKLAWKFDSLGIGYGSPAVSGGRIYIIGSRKDNEYLFALEEKTGNELWNVPIGKVGPNDRKAPFPGPRSTPTVVGELMYTLSSNGELSCLKTSKGELVWQKSLRADFGGTPGYWAYAESPLVDGEVVVCTPGGKKASMVALDRMTGKHLWSSLTPEGGSAAYASAIVGEVGGIRQYIQLFGDTTGCLFGVEAKTGKFLWSYNGTANKVTNILTPIFHNDYVFSSATGTKGGIVKLTAENGGVTAAEVYAHKQLANYMGGFVLVDGHLYGFGGNAIVCVDFLTGKEKWRNQSVGNASVCYADGRVYLRGHKGTTALLEATPEGYREQGRFKQPQRGKGKGEAWAYPVVANGHLYLRDHEFLFCYDVKAGQ